MVVPVGIHYRDYYSFRSNIHITFGKPVDARNYLNSYRQNPQKSFHDFKDKLSVELRKIMVSIDSKEYYDVIKETKDYVADQFITAHSQTCDFADRFHAEKIISESMDIYFANHTEIAEELKVWLAEYKTSLNLLKIDNEAFCSKYSDRTLFVDIARYLFFMPIATIGLIFNAIPALIILYLANNAKDNQYISSIKFGAGAFIFPLYYLIMLLLPYPFIFKILLLVLMPLLGLLAYDYFKGVKRFVSFLRVKIGLNNNNPKISRLVFVRNQMIRIVKTCVDAI